MDKTTKIIVNILKENAVYVVPIFLVIILFVNYVTPEFSKTFDAIKLLKSSKAQFEQNKQQYDMLKAQQDMQNRTKKVVKDGKIIFEAPDMQFSPDASFAPLFELILTIPNKAV